MSSTGNSQNASVDEEVDVLDMEIVIGDQTHVITVYPDSNLQQLTKQFARQNGLSANMEQQLYEEVDAQYQENFLDA